jgi:methylated-DNA-[protein]-cysteine S-methyltransferase
MKSNRQGGTCFSLLDSPVGTLSLVASDLGLHAISWHQERQHLLAAGLQENPHHPVLLETAKQLKEYFGHTRKVFELPLLPQGTPFQLVVWQLLRQIPWGQTMSYGELARLSGDANASRAVGMANNRNPIPIIIPCHRVIGASGSLVGFGGGLANKSYLLDHESQLRLF